MSRNTGASFARSPASRSARYERRAVGERSACARSSARDLGHDLGVAALRGAALTVEPLLDALEIGHHELELERVEVACGVRLDPAVVERAQHHEDRVAVAQRAEHLARRDLRRASRPGGSARCTSSKPAGTTFFDFDIAARRSRRSSGTVAIADRGLVLARRRRAR